MQYTFTFVRQKFDINYCTFYFNVSNHNKSLVYVTNYFLKILSHSNNNHLVSYNLDGNFCRRYFAAASLACLIVFPTPLTEGDLGTFK